MWDGSFNFLNKLLDFDWEQTEPWLRQVGSCDIPLKSVEVGISGNSLGTFAFLVGKKIKSSLGMIYL